MGTRLGSQLAASVELAEEQLPQGSLLELLCAVEDAASMVRMRLVATSPSIVGILTSCSPESPWSGEAEHNRLEHLPTKFPPRKGAIHAVTMRKDGLNVDHRLESDFPGNPSE